MFVNILFRNKSLPVGRIGSRSGMDDIGRGEKKKFNLITRPPAVDCRFPENLASRQVQEDALYYVRA